MSNMIDQFVILFATALSLLILGIYGLATKDSIIKAIISIELLVAAVNLSFLAFGYAQVPNAVDSQSQTFIILSLCIGGAVIGFSLAMLYNIKKKYGNIRFSSLQDLNG
jgi:NADH:ubiquinone oxidoreductase subunit K